MLNEHNLARREFFQFSSLQHLDTSNTGISNVDVETYSKHIQELHEDMKVRFKDVFQLKIPDWVIDLFINISEQGILQRNVKPRNMILNINQNSVSLINHLRY